MEIGVGMIIFIVFVVISIVQKIKERADLARDKRMQPQSRPGEMSERTRQIVHGKSVAMRDADADEARPPRQPADQAKELMRALMGVETVQVVEEEEWEPDAPPPRSGLPRQRRAVPPQLQRQVASPHIESRVQHDPNHEGATTREESIRLRQARDASKRQRVAQQRAREGQAKERTQAAQRQRRKKAPVQQTAPTRRQKRRRLFDGAHEVRKAIVFAEILGPPKAFEDR